MSIELEQVQSAFLWGPRKTGKSTYLKQVFSGSIVYDFLKTDVALDLIREPLIKAEVPAIQGCIAKFDDDQSLNL